MNQDVLAVKVHAATVIATQIKGLVQIFPVTKPVH